jgi:Cysteine rich repeat
MLMLPYRSLGAALILASMSLPSATTAYSQTTGTAESRLDTRIEAAVKKIQDGCGTDVKTYCSNVTPGDERLALCMMAHEDKVSTQCEYALFSAARNLERAMDRIKQTADACWEEIEKHCSDMAGGGRIAQCLISKKASLQSSCQTVLTKFSGQ